MSDIQISSTAASFLCGTIGGFAGVLSGHPLDTVKVRMQTNSRAYKGTFNCFHNIVKFEGVRGLFKGMSSPMAGVMAVNALLFGAYGGLLELQGVSSGNASLTNIFIAGSGSGFINSFISSPIELIKIKLQQKDQKLYRGSIDCTRKIIKEFGLSGLCRGLIPTIVRETPSYGVYFLSYELLCTYLAPENTDPKDLTGFRLMLAGGLGGIFGWLSSYPSDVVKTIIQADNSKKSLTMRSVAVGLFKQEGISAFFRGLTATIVRAFPTNVGILGSYHVSMLYLRKYNLIDYGS
jgi:solute carrier family 25 carnitine/acylcarnitine transporter 20/29